MERGRAGQSRARAQDADRPRRDRQHAQSADPRQRRRRAGAAGMLLQRARHMTQHKGSVSSVLNWLGIALGAAIMIVSEAATIAKLEPFYSWNTPIAWT